MDMAAMADSEGTVLPGRRRGPIRRVFSGGLEYLALLLLVGGVVALGLWLVERSDKTAPALFTGSHFPTCRDAGIVPGSSREGTCTTVHPLVTVVDQGSILVVPGLRARVSKTTLTPATTASGKARRRLRVTVQFSLTNTGSSALFSTRRDP